MGGMPPFLLAKRFQPSLCTASSISSRMTGSSGGRHRELFILHNFCMVARRILPERVLAGSPNNGLFERRNRPISDRTRWTISEYLCRRALYQTKPQSQAGPGLSGIIHPDNRTFSNIRMPASTSSMPPVDSLCPPTLMISSVLDIINIAIFVNTAGITCGVIPLKLDR